MDYDLLLDLAEILAGGYLIFIAIRMHQTQTITENALISKGLDLNKAPDPKNYIKVMVPWNIFAGAVLFLCGAVSRLTTDFENYKLITTVIMFISALCIIVYGYVLMKAQNSYLKQ